MRSRRSSVRTVTTGSARNSSSELRLGSGIVHDDADRPQQFDEFHRLFLNFDVLGILGIEKTGNHMN